MSGGGNVIVPFDWGQMQNPYGGTGASLFNDGARNQNQAWQGNQEQLVRLLGNYAPQATKKKCDYCGAERHPEGYKCKSCGAPK